MALVAATVVSAWQAVVARDAQYQAEADRKQAEADRDRAKAAEGRATTEAAIARAVSDFLQGDLLGQVQSVPGIDREVQGHSYLTVREALDRAAARIGQRFQDNPLVEAAIRQAIGEAYGSVGLEPLAVTHLERALALRHTHLGSKHEDTLGSMHVLAAVYGFVGRHKDAIALHQRLLETRKAMLGPDHHDTLASVGELANAYQMDGQWDTSVQLLESLLERQRTICGPTHPHTLGTMHQLAINYGSLDRFADALALHEKVLKLHKSAIGPGDPSPPWPWLIYAQLCQRVGKLDQAERLLREALEHCRKRDSTCNQRLGTANTLGWLARTLLLQMKYTEAEPLAREAVAIFEKEAPHNQRRFYWVSQLGAIRVGQQKYAEAEPLLLQGYEGMKQSEAILPAGEKTRLTETGERVVRFYEATNQPEKARVWQEKVNAKLPNAASASVK